MSSCMYEQSDVPINQTLEPSTEHFIEFLLNPAFQSTYQPAQQAATEHYQEPVYNYYHNQSYNYYHNQNTYVPNSSISINSSVSTNFVDQPNLFTLQPSTSTSQQNGFTSQSSPPTSAGCQPQSYLHEGNNSQACSASFESNAQANLENVLKFTNVDNLLPPINEETPTASKEKSPKPPIIDFNLLLILENLENSDLLDLSNS